MKHFFIKILILTLFSPFSSLAGGSEEFVKVKSFKQITETKYELEVFPIKGATSESYIDPYMGTCETFKVLGNFSWFDRVFVFPKHVTKDSHIAALKLLKQAQASGETIEFGWMGQGFLRADPNDLCIVRSRVLQLYDKDSIVSFYKYP